MTYLICYDITDDKLRLRLSKRLERAGCVRLQKSVFVANDFDARRHKILRGSLQRILTSKLGIEESVLIFPIERDNLAEMVLSGDEDRIKALLIRELFKIL